MFVVVYTVWVNSPSASIYRLHLILIRHPEGSASVSSATPASFKRADFFQPTSAFSQTDEERQQALQAFTAQSFLTQHAASSSGSGSSVHVFSSPISSSEHKTKMKRVARKTQNEKYRLKYLRLRKAARAFIFVSRPERKSGAKRK